MRNRLEDLLGAFGHTEVGSCGPCVDFVASKLHPTLDEIEELELKSGE